jgi:hypothetical protein
MVETATMKFTAAKTAIMKCHATMVAAGEATMEAATAKAAAVETTTSSSVAATSATTRQRHGWHRHTNRRNCQQRDHCLTQHCHSPSEISLPTSPPIRRW